MAIAHVPCSVGNSYSTYAPHSYSRDRTCWCCWCRQLGDRHPVHFLPHQRLLNCLHQTPTFKIISFTRGCQQTRAFGKTSCWLLLLQLFKNFSSSSCFLIWCINWNDGSGAPGGGMSPPPSVEWMLSNSTTGEVPPCRTESQSLIFASPLPCLVMSMISGAVSSDLFFLGLQSSLQRACSLRTVGASLWAHGGHHNDEYKSAEHKMKQVLLIT